MNRDTYGNVLNGMDAAKALQRRNKEIVAASDTFKANSTNWKAVSFWSDGVRLRGTLWYPPGGAVEAKGAGIVLCHGWGGLEAHLSLRYGSKFAQEGFICLCFDYRGWGSSDGVLVADEADSLNAEARSRDSGTQEKALDTCKVRVVRNTVNMQWQMADIDNAVAFLSSVPEVDASRIGIWGTSQAGGHVLVQAAVDPRVAVCVSQVPSCGVHGAGNMSALSAHTRAQAVLSAQDGHIPNGSIEFHLPGMDGSPILRTIEAHDPLLFCPKIHIPTLVIDVESEDLWDVNKNGRAAHDLIPDFRKNYIVLPNANHYDAYGKAADAARKAAIKFFVKHLVREHIRGPTILEDDELLRKVASGWRSVDLRLLLQPLSLSIEGEIPRELRGTFLRNGPGISDVFGFKLAHPIDGDGLVAALSFDASPRATFQCKFVASTQRQEEQKAGKVLYNGLMGTRVPGGRPGWRDPSHTGVMHIHDRILTLHEYALPHALDPVTLSTIGQDTLGNQLELKTMSAHWRYDNETDRTVTVSFRSGLFGKKPKVSFYEFSSSLQLLHCKRGVSVDSLDYVHDFGLTPKYYLCHVTPFVDTSDATISSGKTPGEAMKFYAHRRSGFVLIGRYTDEILFFEAAPVHIFHFALVRQVDANTIVFTACCLPPNFNMSFQNSVFLSNVAEAPGRFFEYTIDLARGKCTEQLCEGLESTCGEFPTTNPFRHSVSLGKDHISTRFFYFMGSSAGMAIPFCDIVKYDTVKKRVTRYHSQDGVVGEPCFVPRLRRGAGESGAEDDGFLIAQEYSLATQLPSFIVLDAISLVLLARVRLPFHLPYAFHTSFTESLFISLSSKL